MEQQIQQTAQTEVNKILEMLGPENIFAIIGAILLTRTIRGLWYLDKKQSFIVAVCVACLLGILTTYFLVNEAQLKQILGAGFLTVVGSIIAFTILQWGLRMAIELRHGKPGEKTLTAFYFFLSPAPVKIKVKKDDSIVVEEEVQHAELTQLGNSWRLDKERRVKYIEEELSADDMTQYIPPTERAGENFSDEDKTPTPKERS